MTAKRSALRHTVMYGVGTVLQKAVAFLMLPVYTRLLSPADYGTIALVDMTLDVIGIAAGAQIAYALFRFYHQADTAEERRTVVSTSLMLLLASYAVVAVGAYVAAAPLAGAVFGAARHADLLRLASLGLGLQALTLLPLTYLQVLERSGAYVAVTVGKLVLQLSLNIALLVWAKMGVKGMFLSTIISNLVIGTGLTIWIVRDVGLRTDWAFARRLIRYCVPMVGYQFATFVTTFGDRWFLNRHGDEAVVGLYNLSYQFGFLLFNIGYLPFGTLWSGRRFAVARLSDPVERDRELSAGFTKANLLLLTTAVGLALLVGDMLRVMTTPPFYGAAAIVPMVLLAFVLQAWCNIQEIGILLRERTEYLTIANWLAAAVSVGGWFFAVPRWGAAGAAGASLAGFIVRYAFTFGFSQRLWPVRYDWRPTLLIAAYGTAVVLAGRLVAPVDLVTSIAWHASLFVAYLATVWWGGPLGVEGRREVTTLVTRGWTRIRGGTAEVAA